MSVSTVYQILTVCSAISLFTGVMSCECPEESCMRIHNTKRRCDCCVFVFLGKRSGGPTPARVNKKHRDATLSEHTANKKSSQYGSPLYNFMKDLTNQNNDYNNFISQYRDAMIGPKPIDTQGDLAESPNVDPRHDPRNYGLDMNDQDDAMISRKMQTNRKWYDTLRNLINSHRMS